jgi:hypothetical protein
VKELKLISSSASSIHVFLDDFLIACTLVCPASNLPVSYIHLRYQMNCSRTEGLTFLYPLATLDQLVAEHEALTSSIDRRE